MAGDPAPTVWFAAGSFVMGQPSCSYYFFQFANSLRALAHVARFLSYRLNIKQKNFPKELFEVRMYVLRPQQQQEQQQPQS
jgi:hypothetical protein